MDWADDVAYSVHDLEDGVHAGHVDPAVLSDASVRQELAGLARETYSSAPAAELEEAAERLAALAFWPEDFDGSVRALAALKRMTSELIGRLTSTALGATRAAHGDGRLLRYAADLVVPLGVRAECAILKAVADLFVMRRDAALVMQARQREQLAELAAAVLAAAPRSLEPWLREAWAAATDDAARLRVVVDQLASLTDTSALAWWQRWTG
jgi:dGTPase